MEQQSEKVETKVDAGIAERRFRRQVREAQQLWRLCSAVESGIRQHGYRVTVAQVCTIAGMSRRSFYEFFDSLHDAYERMQRAIGRMIERSEYDIVSAYPAALVDYPHAEAMLGLMGESSTMRADRLDHAHFVRDTRYAVESREAPDNHDLVAWATDVMEGRPRKVVQ